MSNIEQTLSIIKPDAVERNLDNEIKAIFAKNNLKIIDSKIVIDGLFNFIKFMKQNLFMMIYVLIFLLDQ